LESKRAKELLEEWGRVDEELRELRRRSADWKYIESLPQRVRRAVLHFVETGDLRESQRMTRLHLEDFVEILRRAGVWT